MPHRDGAYTFTWDGTTARAPFPELDDDERTRHKGELVYPNLFVSLACDHAAAFLLHWIWGYPAPTATEVAGASVLIAAILLLALAPQWDIRRSRER